jgi:guanylate kinase
MDRIIALVGESGSGKTTIAKELEKRGYNVIKSYTTRPEREPGEWGHIFGDMDWYFNDTNGDRVIADTFYNNEYYWATKEQYQGKGTSIYIIDPLGTYSL